LTCHDGFNLGANGSACYGSACIREGNKCILLAATDESSGSPPLAGQEIQGQTSWKHVDAESRGTGFFGPVGGGVVGSALWSIEGQGHGGDGRCPALQHAYLVKASDSYGGPLAIPGNPREQAGLDGKPGKAILTKCKHIGEYTLALQRCRGEDNAWSLHGLWPNGVTHCRGETFDPGQVDHLRNVLMDKWPSCERNKETDEEFWAHEWRKHGSCVGLSQKGYFDLALRLFEEHIGQCQSVTAADCRLCLNHKFKLCSGSV
jgi:hypothetical protein